MRFQPKFGLRLLILAAAIVPIAAWSVFQYRERLKRAEARERIDQIARSQPNDDLTINSRWSFQPGTDFVSLSLGRQPDPQQLLADCRRAGTRIHDIRLNDDCLVDISLAREIAAVPNLAELMIGQQTQIEPPAFAILLAAAPEVALTYDQFQAIRTLKEPVRAPQHLHLWSLPADIDELIQCLQAAVEWQPQSLYLRTGHRLNRANPMSNDIISLRSELTRLQLANRHMLITVRGITDFEGGPAPVYPWKTTELKEMYERRLFANVITEEEAAKLTEELRKQEPRAWPLLQEVVIDDYMGANFGREAELRATELVALAPWSPTAHFNIGLAHFARGEYDKSLESLDRALRCDEFGFDEWIQDRDFANLCVRFQAAAHVATGRRAAGLQVLERHLVSHVEDKRFAVIVFTADWIRCTSPGANSKVADSAQQDLIFAAGMLNESGQADYGEKLTFAKIAVACLQGKFDEAKAGYDPIAKNLNPNIAPRFRVEFKRLGECIQQRKQFVTDYVPVMPKWD